MKTEIQHIESLLRRSFEKNAWYGPSVKETLDGISSEQANHRLQNTHSIIELVAHMTSWRAFVLSRLTGNHHFEVSAETNFPKVDNWEAVVAGLEESQQQLMAAVQEFPDAKLQEIVPHGSHKYTFYTLLHGIIHHDIYHTGQIALIKKSLA